MIYPSKTICGQAERFLFIFALLFLSLHTPTISKIKMKNKLNQDRSTHTFYNFGQNWTLLDGLYQPAVVRDLKIIIIITIL